MGKKYINCVTVSRGVETVGHRCDTELSEKAAVTTNWNQRVQILCSTSHEDVLYFVYDVVD